METTYFWTVFIKKYGTLLDTGNNKTTNGKSIGYIAKTGTS